MHGEMKGKCPGAAYNQVRLIFGILRYFFFSVIDHDSILSPPDDRSTRIFLMSMMHESCFYLKFVPVIVVVVCNVALVETPWLRILPVGIFYLRCVIDWGTLFNNR